MPMRVSVIPDIIGVSWHHLCNVSKHRCVPLIMCVCMYVPYGQFPNWKWTLTPYNGTLILLHRWITRSQWKFSQLQKVNRTKGEAFLAKSEMKKAKRSVSECVVKPHNLWVSSGVSVHMTCPYGWNWKNELERCIRSKVLKVCFE